MKKYIIIVISAIVLIAALTTRTGFYFYQAGKDAQPKQQAVVSDIVIANGKNNITALVFELSYKGKDGVSALDLLKQTATIKTSGTSENTFVTSIDNVTPDSKNNEFWALYINGESATVGAYSLKTKSTDIITWKIGTF